jgi:SulP family sulfate permease
MELEHEKRVRVRTLGKGSVVGELGFYLDVPRSASVIADSKALAYRLTRPAMETMKAQDHELAMAFNDLMVRLVSERLITTNREVAVLNL